MCLPHSSDVTKGVDERTRRVKVHGIPNSIELKFMDSSDTSLPKGGNVLTSFGVLVYEEKEEGSLCPRGLLTYTDEQIESVRTFKESVGLLEVTP